MNNLKEVKTYFSNEKIYQHYFINENDEKEGEYKDWWHGGQQWEISYYKDGKKNGESNVWYYNGQEYLVCNYKNNKVYGINILIKKL